MGRILAAADLVVLRDERSLRFVQEVGAPPERCLVLPDTVFALAPAGGPALRTEVRERPVVAVSVREWAHFEGLDAEEGMRRYVAAVREAVTGLVRQAGAQVVFLSTCQGRPEYWTDDSRLAVEIDAGLPADVREHVEVDRGAYDPAALVARLADVDAMVSTRLHGAITALCAGTPVLAIAYEFKTVEVFGQLGLEEWVLDISDLDGPTLQKRALHLLERRLEVNHRLAPRVGDLREGALAVGPAVARALQEHRR
jgi:colanic acid/amylovoran biosynthesis protein